MSNITAIGVANPRHRFKQSQIADFMIKAMSLDSHDSRKLRAIFSASGIDYRYSVLEDYGRDHDFTFYSNTENFEPFPSTTKRLHFFREHALDLSIQAVQNMFSFVKADNGNEITHLITVSCTGMYAPGLDVELVTRLNLPSTVQRTAINFMGCYAAFNAIKVADAFCETSPKAKVLIVCVELCSLHFQKEATEDNLISNGLFGDGAAAVLVESSTTAPLRLRPQKFRSDLITEAYNDMAWAIGDLGFEMKLSTYVPSFIKGGIAGLTKALLNGNGKNISDIR